MLFQFLELLPTALGCCVGFVLLLSVIIELICGHQTTSIDIACSFVSFFFHIFPVMFITASADNSTFQGTFICSTNTRQRL